MKIDELNDMWAEDANIDRGQLDIESLEIPKLHAKYLRLLSKERLRYKTLQEKKKELIQTLTDYFNGVIDGRDIGREPWQLARESKSSVEKRVELDKQFIEMNIQIYVSEEKVNMLIEIIKNINQRNFQIKGAIDFLRFQNGMN